MTPEELDALNRAISRLFDHWHVDDETGARILAIKTEHYRAWKRGELNQLDDDLKLRLVLLLRVHVRLRTFFVDPGRGYAWMNRSNALFGQSPLSMIAGGDLNALLRLQTYLAAEAHGN